MDASTPGARISRLLRLGVSGGEGSSAGETTALRELEMELALLREENARLKVERHRPPDAGRVIERMRHIGAEPVADGHDDESSASGPVGRAMDAGRAMDDCLAIRDGLIAACQEVQQAMQGIRGRLGALSVDFQEELGERASRGPSAAAGAEEINVELTTADARVSSGFAQTAA